MTFNVIRTLRALGMPEGEIRKMAKSYKGNTLTLGVGTTPDSPQIPGTAKVLLGISALAETAVEAAGVAQVTMKLNNEVIFDRVPLSNITARFQGPAADQYTEIMRRLTGKDVLDVSVTSTVAGNLDYTLIYLS